MGQPSCCFQREQHFHKVRPRRIAPSDHQPLMATVALVKAFRDRKAIQDRRDRPAHKAKKARPERKGRRVLLALRDRQELQAQRVQLVPLVKTGSTVKTAEMGETST